MSHFFLIFGKMAEDSDIFFKRLRPKGLKVLADIPVPVPVPGPVLAEPVTHELSTPCLECL